MSRQDKSTTDKNAKTLRELIKRPENKVCADCKRNDPRWASWNIGVFVCIRCSGIHRSMGTHISKVKSVDLDMWTPEQMRNVQIWGNERANLYWEAHLKSGHVPPEHKMDSFIRSKYESRRWAREGPPPDDPSVLDHIKEESDTPPNQEVRPTAAAAPPATSSRSRTSRSTLTPNTFVPPSRVDPLLTPITAPSIAPSSQAPALATASARTDLFSLDFTPPTTTSAPALTAKKDVKNDILSLFGSGTSTSNSFAPAPASTSPTSFMGQGGISMWGAQSGWSAPAPIATSADPWVSYTSASAGQATPSQPPNGFGFARPIQQQQQPIQAGNVWGAPVPAAGALDSGNAWGAQSTTAIAPATSPFDFSVTPSVGPSAAQVKRDDAFGDLWGGFKQA